MAVYNLPWELTELRMGGTAIVLALVAGLMIIATLLSLVLNPLRHIPGPWLPALSSMPLFWQALGGRKAMWIKQLHQQYGPVILIAPNKVCVSAESGIKQIYSNKASKSHAYDAFRLKEVKMCIGLLDVKSAHTRRKALLPAFSRQNLVQMEPVIRQHLERFLDWLVKFDEQGTAVDLFKWYRYLTFDVVADIAFGQQIGMLDGTDTHFFSQIELRNTRNSLIGPFPFLLSVMRLLRPKLAKKWVDADDEIAKYAVRAREGWATAGKCDRSRVDILARLEEAAKSGAESVLSDREIIAEMMEIMNAGSDTTANTAMFTTWELASRPDVQSKLFEELREAFPDPQQPLDLTTLENLPFLDGVCREGLRLHAPIPSYLERVAPVGGLDIAGYQIPEGTVVGMQAYTNHRNNDVYPDAENFVPERWFDATPSMKLNFLPFSAGPRSCIGLNLANMQLRIHLGHIFRRYRVSLAASTTVESMRHVEFFTIRPKSGRCEVHFHHR